MININNLKYKYPNGHHAINDLSMAVSRGERIGIIGANGAGKSTLLHLILGLYQYQSGEIIIDQTLINSDNIKKSLNQIGMVFQNPDHQLFMNTVFEDVAFGPFNEGLSHEIIEKRVDEALGEVGIMHLKDHSTFKLSGGEKRAVAIATVLSMKPKIILMDEPASNLDAKTRRRLINLIKRLPQTMLITSHDLDFIFESTGRVMVMAHGRIIHFGNTQALLSNREMLEKCGLELPMRLQGCPICSKI